jgi:hypothetical protein
MQTSEMAIYCQSCDDDYYSAHQLAYEPSPSLEDTAVLWMRLRLQYQQGRMTLDRSIYDGCSVVVVVVKVAVVVEWRRMMPFQQMAMMTLL